jgi:hypothetical protein
LILILSVLPATVSRAEPTTIYASPTGSGSGGHDDPASLGDAVIWAYGQKDRNGTYYITLRGGEYYFDETLLLTRDFPGTTIFQAYPNETPVFTAGRRITGFVEETLNGIIVFAADVSSIMNHPDKTVVLPGTPVNGGDFLFVYDEAGPLQNSRSPSSGYYYVKEAPEDYAAKPLALTEEKEMSAMNQFYGFIASDNHEFDLSSAYNANDITIRIPHLWKDETARIAAFERDTGLLMLSRLTSLTVRSGDRYYLENVREALQTPGEWYLDRTRAKFYYVPREGETAGGVSIYAGVLDRLLQVSNCKNVSFSGITFNGTGRRIGTDTDFPQAAVNAESAVLVTSSSNITFNGCVFTNIGNTALKLGRGTTNAYVTNCEFDNIGANAIYTEGANLHESAYITKNITIEDNTIHRYGRMNFNAVGILLIHTANAQVLRNTVYDGYYTAISAGWVWGYTFSATHDIRIEDNTIYNIGQGMLSDMGGIYLLGEQRGTVVARNTIYNVRSLIAGDPKQGYGGWGIYLDEGSSYILIQNNRVFACGSEGLFINYGLNNELVGNIIAYNDKGQMAIHHYYDRLELTMSDNIFIGDAATMINEAKKGSIAAPSTNAYYDPKLKDGGKSVILARLQELGISANAKIEDPGDNVSDMLASLVK